MASFRETLDRHLAAVAGRDEETFAETVDPDEVLVVTAEGEVITDPDLFVKRHRDWFDDPAWRLETDVIWVREGDDLATAVIRLAYRDGDGAMHPSVLGLVFRRDGERWLMIEDQNTPVR